MKAKSNIMIAMLIFGSIGLFVREIPLPSDQIALVRGGIGSIFLLVTSIVMKKRMSWKAIRPNLLLLTISGAAIGFNWILLFEAYRYTTIANATLSYYFAPVFVVFLSPIVLKERLSRMKIVCVFAALIGMYLIVGVGNGGGVHQRQLTGIGFGLCAAVLYAIVVLINKFLKGLTGLETTFVQLSMASLVLLPYVLLSGPLTLGQLEGKSLAVLVIVGLLNTGIAYLLYFTAIQKLNSQTAAIYSYIDPISAIVMSAIFLGENMSTVQIVGGILILGAAYLSGKNQQEKVT